MISERFTMRLDPELRSWLEKETKRRDRSAAYVAKQALFAMKEQSEAKERMIAEAFAEADKGEFISEIAMTAWFESLGTDNELVEPEADIFLHRA